MTTFGDGRWKGQQRRGKRQAAGEKNKAHSTCTAVGAGGPAVHLRFSGFESPLSLDGSQGGKGPNNPNIIEVACLFSLLPGSPLGFHQAPCLKCTGVKT